MGISKSSSIFSRTSCSFAPPRPEPNRSPWPLAPSPISMLSLCLHSAPWISTYTFGRCPSKWLTPFHLIRTRFIIHTTLNTRIASGESCCRWTKYSKSSVRASDLKMPVEVADPIPFDQDKVHHSYDAEYAHRFWRILLSVDEVFKVFRSRFVGKSSPVHFFWGSFDLAVTRFSGRRAPERQDADPILRKIMQEAYSHEVISAGWWPGGGTVQDAAFYCYAAPTAAGFEKQTVRPAKAYYDSALGEYLLMYDDVRLAESPKTALLDFLQSTYEAGATTANWDRKALERPEVN